MRKQSAQTDLENELCDTLKLADKVASLYEEMLQQSQKKIEFLETENKNLSALRCEFEGILKSLFKTKRSSALN